MKVHGDRTFQCEYCDKSFFSKQSLSVHESAKHTKKDFKHCEICGKSFSTQRVLASHMKQKHKVENRFQCKLCRKYFLTESGLRTHELQDTCQKNKCTQCGKIFTCVSDLVRHEKVHLNPETENKQFPCHLCEKGFTRMTTLKEHYKKCHEDAEEGDDDKKYICHCGKSFAKENNFHKHKATHYQEMAFHPPPSLFGHNSFQWWWSICFYVIWVQSIFCVILW